MTPNLGIIHIQGTDAKRFLQGQLTVNLETLEDERPVLAAHCNPQGRIISLFNILKYHDDYFIITDPSMIDKTQAALKKYAIFFKVTLQQITELPFLYQPISKNDAMRAGIPAIYPTTSERFLPHELNLPELKAVSFDKGCFTGQEIIARMHYRGKLKKHLYCVKIVSPAPLEPGIELYTSPDQTDASSIASIIDSAPENSDNYLVLMVCDDDKAHSGQFFLSDKTAVDVDFNVTREVT